MNDVVAIHHHEGPSRAVATREDDVPVGLSVAAFLDLEEGRLGGLVELFAIGRASAFGLAEGGAGVAAGLVEAGPGDLPLDGDVDVGGYAEGRRGSGTAATVAVVGRSGAGGLFLAFLFAVAFAHLEGHGASLRTACRH